MSERVMSERVMSERVMSETVMSERTVTKESGERTVNLCEDLLPPPAHTVAAATHRFAAAD